MEVFSTTSIRACGRFSDILRFTSLANHSYVTPVLPHDPFPSVRQRRQSALTHRLCLKGSDVCSMVLKVVPDCSTTLNLYECCGFDLSHVPVFKLEPGVAGTKITVSKSPVLNQLSGLFLPSRARSNAVHSLGLYNGFSPLASSSNSRL